MAGEATWSGMQKVRLEHGLLRCRAELNYRDEMGVNAEVTAKVARLGLNLGGSLDEFHSRHWVFDVEFWIEIGSERDKRKIESDVRFQIDKLAQTAGLTIAYPQRDVHIDAAGPLSVRILPPST